MNAKERVKICKETRSLTAQVMANVLAGNKTISETDFCQNVTQKLSASPKLWNRGWYEPPPNGVGALFASEQNPQRLAYDNLRKEEFWPQANNIFTENSVGYIYASPVNKLSGIIGDFGMTIYKGMDKKIIEHIKNCLGVTEKTTEFVQVGMEFKEVYEYCQKLMRKKGLNNSRTIAYTDQVGTNIGHTIPWSYEEPGLEKQQVIEANDFDKIKNLIRTERIHLNTQETFKIPPTIAFTVEPRAENSDFPNLPMASFHSIVTFTEGKKEILGNFNPVFKILEMDKFITSKY